MVVNFLAIHAITGRITDVSNHAHNQTNMTLCCAWCNPKTKLEDNSCSHNITFSAKRVYLSKRNVLNTILLIPDLYRIAGIWQQFKPSHLISLKTLSCPASG